MIPSSPGSTCWLCCRQVRYLLAYCLPLDSFDSALWRLQSNCGNFELLSDNRMNWCIVSISLAAPHKSSPTSWSASLRWVGDEPASTDLGTAQCMPACQSAKGSRVKRCPRWCTSFKSRFFLRFASRWIRSALRTMLTRGDKTDEEGGLITSNGDMHALTDGLRDSGLTVSL
jgi:hypothetical protein